MLFPVFVYLCTSMDPSAVNTALVACLATYLERDTNEEAASSILKILAALAVVKTIPFKAKREWTLSIIVVPPPEAATPPPEAATPPPEAPDSA
jgi:hypothetical protein